MLRITKAAEAAIDNCLAHFLTDELVYRINDNGQILAIPGHLDEPDALSDIPGDCELIFTIVYDAPSIRLVAQSDLSLFNLCREFCIEQGWDLNIERARCEIVKIIDCMRWMPGSREEVACIFSQKGEGGKVAALREQLEHERREREAAQRTIARLGGVDA